MEEGMFLMSALVSSLIALIGQKREIGYVWSFIACLLLSPLIGLIIILFSRRKTDNTQKK
jgi:ABC-type uncharacterized transport system permease subunit